MQCCTHGQGYYKFSLLEDDGSWNTIISGGTKKTKEETHVINLEPQTMTKRDQEWLDSHNIRRKEWHEDYDTTYVPLKWSNGLKDSSMEWATKMLDRCVVN